MSEWGYENSEQSAQAGNELNGPKALREAYDAMKKQNDELSAKLTSFLEDQQKQKMAVVFESLGVPEAAKVYQGDADPEKAKQWVESMQSVFGGNVQGNPASSTQAPQPTLTAAEQHQLSMMNQAGVNEAALGSVEAAQVGLGSANSLDELLATMNRLQGGA